MAEEKATGSKYVLMIDGSAESIQAAKLCATFCKAGDTIILYNNFMSVYYFGHIAVPTHEDFEKHKKMIMDAAQFFRGKDVKLFRKVEGTPDCRNSMTIFLEDQKPDFVFMGNRGLGDFQGVFGSVSQYVLHHYEKDSICLVRGFPAGDTFDNSKPLHFMLCVDGSDYAKRAAETLAKTMKPTDKVTLYSSTEAPSKFIEQAGSTTVVALSDGIPWTNWVLVPNPKYEKEYEDAEKKAQECLEAAKEVLTTKNEEIKNIETITAVTPEPKVAVEKWASDEKNAVDVVVMGTRGRGLMKRLVLGSFSNHVFHNVPNKAFLIIH